MAVEDCLGVTCEFYRRYYEVDQRVKSSNGSFIPRVDLPPRQYCVHPKIFTVVTSLDLGIDLLKLKNCPLK